MKRYLLRTGSSWPNRQKHAEQEREPLSLDERIRRYIAACPEAIEGHYGDGTTYGIACQLVWGFALSESDALRYLRLYNETRCRPKWTERDLRAKIAQSFKRTSSDSGSFTPRSCRWSNRKTSAYMPIIDKHLYQTHHLLAPKLRAALAEGERREQEQKKLALENARAGQALRRAKRTAAAYQQGNASAEASREAISDAHAEIVYLHRVSRDLAARDRAQIAEIDARAGYDARLGRYFWCVRLRDFELVSHCEKLEKLHNALVSSIGNV